MKHTIARRMGAAALPVLFAVLSLSDANAALCRTETFGFSIEELNLEDLKGLNADSGVRVADVAEYGPADKAGINAGDVILEVDGEKVKQPEDVKEILSRKKDSEKVYIRLIRKGSKGEAKTGSSEVQSELWIKDPEAGSLDGNVRQYNPTHPETDFQTRELPGEMHGPDIQSELDQDIRAKLKAEMAKVENDLYRKSTSQIKDLGVASSKI